MYSDRIAFFVLNLNELKVLHDFIEYGGAFHRSGP